jgi:hypothetical protein
VIHGFLKGLTEVSSLSRDENEVLETRRKLAMIGKGQLRIVSQKTRKENHHDLPYNLVYISTALSSSTSTTTFITTDHSSHAKHSATAVFHFAMNVKSVLMKMKIYLANSDDGHQEKTNERYMEESLMMNGKQKNASKNRGKS